MAPKRVPRNLVVPDVFYDLRKDGVPRVELAKILEDALRAVRVGDVAWTIHDWMDDDVND